MTPEVWPRRRAARFQGRLLAWYARARRTLPWRTDADPYRVWVSEIMLQQTQVRTVLPYFERFLERFPDVDALAAASEAEVLQAWAGLGYYRRARDLRRAARVILERHGGRFPGDPESIRALPGIGRYTAGAIASIAFGLPEPIVDGNVRRVISRLHGIANGAPEGFFWDQAAAWIPEGRAADFNQAVMELGALICVPAQPLCPRCPVRGLCRARRAGTEARIPALRRARPPEEVDLVMVVLEADAGVLLVREREAEYIPGEWGLPTAVLRPGESAAARGRALARPLAGRAVALRQAPLVRHGVTYRRLRIHVFHGSLDGPIAASRAPRSRVTELAAARRRLTSSAFRKVLDACAPPGRFPRTSRER